MLQCTFMGPTFCYFVYVEVFRTHQILCNNSRRTEERCGVQSCATRCSKMG